MRWASGLLVLVVLLGCVACSPPREAWFHADASTWDQREDEPLPDGTVTISCGGPASGQVLTGTNNFVARRYAVAAGYRAIIMRPWHGAIGSRIDGQPVGRPMDGVREYITQTRAIDRSGRVLGNASLQQVSSGLAFAFREDIRIEAGMTQPYDLIINVAEGELVPRTFTGHYYDVSLEMSSMNFTYADTGEAVPSSLISLAANCNADPHEVSFYVRSRNADVSVTRAASTPFELVTPAPNALSMVLNVTNEGMTATELSGFDLTASVTTDWGSPLVWAMVVDECRLMNSGNVIATFVPTNSAAVRGLHVPLNTLVNQELQLYCDYHWPQIGANSIQISLGIRQNSISLGSQGTVCAANDLITAPTGAMAQIVLHR